MSLRVHHFVRKLIHGARVRLYLHLREPLFAHVNVCTNLCAYIALIGYAYIVMCIIWLFACVWMRACTCRNSFCSYKCLFVYAIARALGCSYVVVGTRVGSYTNLRKHLFAHKNVCSCMSLRVH